MADHTGMPVYPRTHQEILAAREKLKHLYQFNFHCIGD
jgi:hypothetical protein